MEIEKSNNNKMQSLNYLRNIIFFNNRLRNKIIYFKPEILKEEFEHSYLCELEFNKLKINYLEKHFDPGTFKDEKMKEFEQEMEDLKKIYEEGSFMKLFEYKP